MSNVHQILMAMGGAGGAISYAFFDQASSNGTIGSGGETLTKASGSYAHATCSQALHENTYLEFAMSNDDSYPGFYAGTTAVGSWPTYAPLSVLWEYPAVAGVGGPWSASVDGYYGLDESFSQDIANYGSSQGFPQYIHFAYVHASRALFARVRSGGTTYAWDEILTGSNPSTNTNPIFTFPGTDPIRAAGSVGSGVITMLHPDDYQETAPSGFTPGVTIV